MHRKTNINFLYFIWQSLPPNAYERIIKNRTKNVALYLSTKCDKNFGGSGEIRTHEPLRVTAFRVRAVMTTSIRFQTKTPYIAQLYIWRLVDGGGFEPPKAVLADLQSAPFGHSGTRPYFPDKRARSIGAEDGTWTRNLLITSQLLYRLSYFGAM